MIDKQALNKALDWAIRKTLNEACAFLVDAGADISDGRLYHQPLTMAVEKGRRDIVAFLLDRGADVNLNRSVIGEVIGESLLTIAVDHRHRDLTEYLLGRGADMNYQSGDGTAYSSALRAAIKAGDEAMITLLSQRGADLNAVQSNGYPTAIHQVSAQNSVAIVDLLISLGADFNSPQRHYGTPLMLSIYKGCFTTAELLIIKGANINEVNVPLIDPKRLFTSAIHIAIYVSAPHLVGLLLRNGVGTDLHEAYEFAAQHNAFLSRQLAPGGSMEDYELEDMYPMTGIFDWEKRFAPELLSDAAQVLELLRKQKERSGV